MKSAKWKKCYLCEEGELVTKQVVRKLYDKRIGRFQAEVCTSCGEVFYDEETSKKITAKTKELGLWGLEARTKIGISGSTLDVRLSKKLVDFFHLKKGQEIKVYPENEKRFIVEVV